MMSYLYNVNASDVIQLHSRIHNFPQRVRSSSPYVETFNVLNEKDMQKKKKKGRHL